MVWRWRRNRPVAQPSLRRRDGRPLAQGPGAPSVCAAGAGAAARAVAQFVAPLTRYRSNLYQTPPVGLGGSARISGAVGQGFLAASRLARIGFGHGRNFWATTRGMRVVHQPLSPWQALYLPTIRRRARRPLITGHGVTTASMAVNCAPSLLWRWRCALLRTAIFIP